MKNILSAIIVTLSLSSCSYFIQKKTPEIDFLEKAPKADFEEFFKGEIESFGIIQDANSKIIGSYTAKMNGEWDANKGVLKQNFLYNDGKKDNRTWLITKNSDGTLDAVGHDVTVPAKGKQVGNTIQILYSLFVTENGVKQNTSFEDNFYLVDSNSMICISVAKSVLGKVTSKAIVSLNKVNKNIH